MAIGGGSGINKEFEICAQDFPETMPSFLCPKKKHTQHYNPGTPTGMNEGASKWFSHAIYSILTIYTTIGEAPLHPLH
jgi:hypothetical protein